MVNKSFFLLFVPVLLLAEDAPYEAKLRSYFEAKSASDRADLLEELKEPPRAAKAFEDLTTVRRVANRRLLLGNVELGRADEDLSSSGRTDGSTALASVAGIVNDVSVAVENGAFTQTANGTVTTVRVRPIAIYDAFAHKTLRPCAQFLVLVTDKNGERCGTAVDRYFRGFSFAASLDSAQAGTIDAQPEAATSTNGTATPLAVPKSNLLSFLTQRRAITSWSLRYELYNPRDARNSSFVNAWNTALMSVQASAGKFAVDINTAFAEILLKPDYIAWAQTTNDRLETAGLLGWEALEKVWIEQLDAFAALESVRNSSTIPVVLATAKQFVSEENAALKKELDKPIISIEYTDLRPLNQPDTSNVKLMISKGFWTDRVAHGGEEAMFSVNVGANLYNTVPAGAKVGHLRDVQAALQWDVPIGAPKAQKPAVFTLAAYYQYQIEKGLILIGAGDMVPNAAIQLPKDAKTLLAPSGGIFIAQAKLTFKAGDSKAKVPVSVTWANRTELIKAPEIRGNVGFQFDWDAIFGRNN